jgi:hypothetical protein
MSLPYLREAQDPGALTAASDSALPGLIVLMVVVVTIAVVIRLRGDSPHGPFHRWRQRRLRTALARAEQYLAACQRANENHPGLYDDLVAGAEADVSRLRRGIDSQVSEQEVLP